MDRCGLRHNLAGSSLSLTGERLLDTKCFLLKSFWMIIAAWALFGLSGCATTPDGSGADWETWTGKLAGRVDGDLALLFSRFEEGDGVHLVKGRFEGGVAGGYGGYGSGTVDGLVEGKFKDGIFDLHLSGEARLNGTVVLVNGKMTGTMSQTAAFGTWYMVARSNEDAYRLSGEWRADRTEDGFLRRDAGGHLAAKPRGGPPSGAEPIF